MRVLIIDDEKNIRESIGKYLRLENIDSCSAKSGEEAITLLEKESFDAAIIDLKLPGMSGQGVLDWIQQRGLGIPSIMISAHGEIADAVAALKGGAKDYLVKPFDPAELVIKLKSLVENKRRENLVEAGLRTENSHNALLGEAAQMKKISTQIDKIADADRNTVVLITGESGTGKEVAAREIHRRGRDAAEPFVAVNVGGIHEGLMESELFGHEKGAFTGAASRKQGLFELAGGGTIFLDEIGEMPMILQVKLLRVLQERKIRRLGGLSDIPIAARIISATNRDLEEEVREGRFREDLYFRLNVFRISLPPLRERREDIPLLAKFILRRRGKEDYSFSSKTMEKLVSYSFPGNIRELENILERALIFCEDRIIRAEDIDIHEQNNTAERTQDGISLDEIEKQAIIDTLAACNGNRTRAALQLGVSRKTVLNKIKIYGLR
ncbi:MAG: sigma-54 dependent transcriptional regulator [Treponema sp.]|jgi:two-component system response regulator AtoC|nr:sigma-54 dependent transcriptional regulator [Treponema sp.]